MSKVLNIACGLLSGIITRDAELVQPYTSVTISVTVSGLLPVNMWVGVVLFVVSIPPSPQVHLRFEI